MNRILQIASLTLSCVPAIAQQFTGFTPGNLVVSRTVYQGSAATLAAGQPLPPVCPATAACGKAVATDNGAFPGSATATNNVFNNNNVDGSFGVTSPIYLDQIGLNFVPAGAVINTLAIPPNLVTTSFSSKSELALNLSADGTALTFMGYVTPPNTVDVSNSNTPGAYDPTNPSGGSFYRAVIQVGANGALQVTPTNSYSGNNGRAAALANGVYYMVGNSNNGAGTPPANITSAAGAQIAVPGQSFATPAQEIGLFSISQVTNPATGLPYPPDKAGKDNNFRGLTIFNNTMYVSKGSGGNGLNTVYRVGDQGMLPTPANAASASLTVLPGFPTTPAKASTATFPFGMFFANANTLYVADEGDGTIANAGTSKTSGLQKWVLNNGTWTMVYVLQNGLNLGQQYSVPNYPPNLFPATDGLRNITGRVNSNGTVTIWGVTSTVSASGDQGADPNQLVTVIDTLASTDPTTPSREVFSTIQSAPAGTVLRGVALTPAAGTAPAVNVPLVLSAANPSSFSIAPGSLATANGFGLSSASATLAAPFPTSSNGVSVSIMDSNGVATAAPLLSLSPTQIVFLVPSKVAPGTAQIQVVNGPATLTSSNVEISTAAPGILTLNGEQLPAAIVVQVASTGVQTVQQVYTTNSGGAVVPSPVQLGGGNTTYLVVFGTGIAAAGTALTSATINGVNAPVVYAGPSGGNGLDQVNIRIPASLAGKGSVNLQLTAEGNPANSVQLQIQ